MTGKLHCKTWEENYNNPALSGIEVIDKYGKLVNFITICHDEILGKHVSHRISLKLDDNSKPIFPPARTFEEIMQAKRRQQMAPSHHYHQSHQSHRHHNHNASNSSSVAAPSSSSTPSAAPTAAAAPPTIATTAPTAPATTGPTPAKQAKLEQNATSAKAGPSKDSTITPVKDLKGVEAVIKQEKTSPSASSKAGSSKETGTHMKYTSASSDQVSRKDVSPSASKAGTSKEIVTSMRDLKRITAFESVDPKAVKLLLKSASPGASVVLPNGTVIRKSRRGGARAGAGRKRSRPLPGMDSNTTPANVSSASIASSKSLDQSISITDTASASNDANMTATSLNSTNASLASATA